LGTSFRIQDRQITTSNHIFNKAKRRKSKNRLGERNHLKEKKHRQPPYYGQAG